MTQISLSKPVNDDGKSISTITFREPNGFDLIECGMPWRFSQDGEGKSSRHMDTRAIGSLISSLGNVSFAAVNQLSGKDFLAASGIVMGFFKVEDTAGSS